MSQYTTYETETTNVQSLQSYFDRILALPGGYVDFINAVIRGSIDEGISAASRRVMESIKASLANAGLTLEDLQSSFPVTNKVLDVLNYVTGDRLTLIDRVGLALKAAGSTFPSLWALQDALVANDTNTQINSMVQKLIKSLDKAGGFVDYMLGLLDGSSSNSASEANRVLHDLYNDLSSGYPEHVEYLSLELPVFDKVLALLQSGANGQSRDELIDKFWSFAGQFYQLVPDDVLKQTLDKYERSGDTVPVEPQDDPAEADDQGPLKELLGSGGLIQFFVDILKETITGRELITKGTDYYNKLLKVSDPSTVPGSAQLETMLRLMRDGTIDGAEPFTEIELPLHKPIADLFSSEEYNNALADYYKTHPRSQLRYIMRTETSKEGGAFDLILALVQGDTVTLDANRARARQILDDLNATITKYVQDKTDVSMIRGLPFLLNLLGRIAGTSSSSRINTHGELMNVLKDNIRDFGILNEHQRRLLNAYNKPKITGDIGDDIKTEVNKPGGFMSVLFQVLTNPDGVVMKNISDQIVEIYGSLVLVITNRTYDSIDDLEKHVVGLKDVFLLCNAIMDGKFSDGWAIGAAAVEREDNLLEINKGSSINIADAFANFGKKSANKGVERDIAAYIDRNSGILQMFIDLLNLVYTNNEVPFDKVAVQAKQLQTDLRQYLEKNKGDKTVDDLIKETPDLANIDKSLTDLQAPDITQDGAIAALEPSVKSMSSLVTTYNAQEVKDAMESAVARRSYVTIRDEFDNFLQQPNGIFALFTGILRGTYSANDTPDLAQAETNELNAFLSTRQGLIPLPETQALQQILQDLINSRFNTDEEFAEKFAVLLYRIETVNRKGTGKNALRVFQLRSDIRKKFMDRGSKDNSDYGAFMFFARVLQSEITDPEVMREEAAQIRYQLFSFISELNVSSISDIRAQVGGIGQVLDILRAIQITNHLDGRFVALQVRINLPTFLPISTTYWMGRLEDWVNYYLKNHPDGYVAEAVEDQDDVPALDPLGY